MNKYLNIIKSLYKKLLLKWRPVLTIIISIYIAYLLIDIIFFEDDPGKKSHMEALLGDIKLEGYSAGKKQWEFTSDELEYRENNRVLAKKNAKGIIYKEDKPFIEVNASRVDFDMQTKNFDAMGGVIIRVIEQDQEFQSDMLKWNAGEEKCEASGKVVARFRDNILSADSFVYFVKQQRFEMNNQVRLELDIEVH
ncbi:MAG: LPS export ABC transporter periplasmic protein LptC [Candidatus Eremiobacterota bacterium]